MNDPSGLPGLRPSDLNCDSMYAVAFSSPGVPGARPCMESADRSLMCCSNASAVMACAALSTSAELVAPPLLVASVLAHAATAMDAASAAITAIGSLELTKPSWDECLRIAILLPRSVHGIGKNEPAPAEVGKRPRIISRGLRHSRKIENVVAEVRHDVERWNPGDRAAAAHALEARILVALTGWLAQHEIRLDAGRLEIRARRRTERVGAIRHDRHTSAKGVDAARELGCAGNRGRRALVHPRDPARIGVAAVEHRPAPLVLGVVEHCFVGVHD